MAKSLWLCWLLLLSGSLFAAPRVITLAPHLTELAFSAGITPVAVSAWSDYPPAAKNIEQVANWQGINLERILQLKPDVVLAWRGGNPTRQLDLLQRTGIDVEWIDPDSISDMIAALTKLARWSPHPEQANEQAQQLRQQEIQLRQRYSHLPAVPVFLQFGMQPLFTAAKDTLQNNIIQLCAGKNVFADSRVSWPQVSREQVLMRHPQAIIIGGSEQQAKNVAQFWQPQLTVPVIAINDDWLSRPGPRMLMAAAQLCAALHPEATK
ncbi:vitamin B12 ABC transporter substrate-binding protein BtuF [Candidatus Pantoea multigeneris]|uniref:Vitamin B12-binding protein n=1 Tax=Candidatus Pantoea multigeneris TaxID=2608357 RepID=A0ABX0R6V9_9GAMM|nr:vitamin B12 ABC transporter substrate-binding protein BtuF [Pantoea multigeneris]